MLPALPEILGSLLRVEAAVNETMEIFKATIFYREQKHYQEVQHLQTELEAER